MGRWFIAAVVTVAVFWIALLVPALVILPRYIASDADRWVIAAGLGVAVAALAALWGAGFARREPADSQRAQSPAVHMSAEASGNARVNQAGGDLTIRGE
jgi:hypothetical protein